MITRYIIHHIALLDAVCLLLPLLLLCIGWRAMRRRRKCWGACCIAVGCIAGSLYAYGRYFGSLQFEVRRVEFASADLPAAFDGYRIVQFSDAHLGSFAGSRQAYIRRVVDSINAQHPDMVVFTGDLQNISFEEIEPHKQWLSRIEAADGVFSVLGNHDYADYLLTDDPVEVNRQQGGSVGMHQELGWVLLRNSWRRVQRDSASIVIAGMENDGEGRFPGLGDHVKALYGLDREEFVVMLEHDPTSWQRRILPHTHVQLTLSGHTHGGQIALFGWSPAQLLYRQSCGMYYAGGRAIYVSKGLGGAIPWRIGVPGEIVVITLKTKKK